MFEAATLKLTGWYLGIMMAVSLVFSFVIYQINFHEVTTRFEVLLREATAGNQAAFLATDQLIRAQTEQAAFQILLTLLWINLFVLIAGGIGSYWLARRTLRPIEKAHEAERRFTSDASHELRTPLASIKAEIEVMLREKKLSPADARELMESNLEEIDKLIQVTNMLLNLSRLDYDRLEMKRVNLDLLLKEALKRFKDSTKRFVVSSKKASFVKGNRTALVELMSILVDNALKYGRKTSPIVITLSERNKEIIFEINNEGPTIPASKLPHLFERFYRADSSRTQSANNGYGLGLAIAKKIVDVHGGRIKVTSRSNKTTFRFFLPVIGHKKPNGKITTK